DLATVSAAQFQGGRAPRCRGLFPRLYPQRLCGPVRRQADHRDDRGPRRYAHRDSRSARRCGERRRSPCGAIQPPRRARAMTPMSSPNFEIAPEAARSALYRLRAARAILLDARCDPDDARGPLRSALRALHPNDPQRLEAVEGSPRIELLDRVEAAEL